jgi:hypothetical protein
MGACIPGKLYTICSREGRNQRVKESLKQDETMKDASKQMTYFSAILLKSEGTDRLRIKGKGIDILSILLDPVIQVRPSGLPG